MRNYEVGALTPEGEARRREAEDSFPTVVNNFHHCFRSRRRVWRFPLIINFETPLESGDK